MPQSLYWSECVGTATCNILDQIWNGDSDAFTDLCGELASWVRGKFPDTLCVANDADEIAGEAIVRACRKRSEFRGEAKLSTWLTAITRRVALEYIRKQGRGIPLQYEGEELDVADPTPNAEEQMMDEEDAALKRAYVQDALAALNQREKEAVVLVDCEAVPVKGVAIRWDTTEDAVSSLLRRAREKMRQRLKGVAWREV